MSGTLGHLTPPREPASAAVGAAGLVFLADSGGGKSSMPAAFPESGALLPGVEVAVAGRSSSRFDDPALARSLVPGP